MHFQRGTTGTQRGLTQVGGFVFLQTELKAAHHIATHTHEHATIVLVLDGDYSETYRGGSQGYSPLTVIAKPAGERHANNIGQRGARCLVVELTEEKIRDVGRVTRVWDTPLARTGGGAAIAGLKILRELREPDAFSPLALESAALQLLVELSRQAPRSYPGEPRWMKATVELLHASPVAPRLSEIAATLDVHPVHLAHTFKRVHGCSIGRYARRLQVDRTVAMLTRSSAALSEVAIAAGFYDQSHMARVMKRETGMSASQIRAAAAG